MEMFLVGGAVRDEILGHPSKDIDFTVVLPPVEGDPFLAMKNRLKMMGFKIFLETPEFLTVRAQFPAKEVRVGGELDRFAFANPRLTADFVLARKESDYTDGRRPDMVVPGTLEDDLARRDFTMNAIAEATDGSLIDPFNGVEDIANKVIRAVGDPMERLSEDALRAARALRFSVTKGFSIHPSVAFAMESMAVLDSIRNTISDERIREEVNKMFAFDTMKTLRAFTVFPHLTSAMFSGSVSLEATMKKRKGK